VQFTSKLTEADLSDVRMMIRSKMFWQNSLLYVAGLLFYILRAWTITSIFFGPDAAGLEASRHYMAGKTRH
jgi:hypothetical protein